MKITKNNYLKLKRLLIDELIDDVMSAYQLGTDELSWTKLNDDFHQLILTLGCFDDGAAVRDVQRAYWMINGFNNSDAEDQIESWLDQADLD